MPKKNDRTKKPSPGTKRFVVGTPPAKARIQVSNEEIMHRALERTGKVTLNITFRVYDPEARYYRQLHDTALVAEVRSPGMVKRIQEEIKAMLQDPDRWK